MNLEDGPTSYILYTHNDAELRRMKKEVWGPVRSMGFKIAEYQRGIREARREFTGGYFGLLKGGPIDANDIIKRYITSNKLKKGHKKYFSPFKKV